MSAKKIEVVILGCGIPKFSMGWTHLYQMFLKPLDGLADVVGVVEPFFLSDAGKAAKGGDLFQAYVAENPSIPFVDSCHKLPPVGAGRIRVAVIAVRTPDARRYFEDAVLVAGCRGVYLEKPGATTVAEIDAMTKLAKEKQVTVLVGYSRNVSGFIKRGREYAGQRQAATGAAPKITLMHSNPFTEEELPACFQRCKPGMMYDMACHDLALAVAFYGLTADSYTDLKINPERSVQAEYGGIKDFVRLDFSLRPKEGADPINFLIDRCTGSFNGIEVEAGKPEAKRFLSGEPPLLFENPLEDLSSHLAVQYDLYVEGKRILLESLVAAIGNNAADFVGTAALPKGTPTLEVAREVLVLADKLTADLQAKVPFAAPGSRL